LCAVLAVCWLIGLHSVLWSGIPIVTWPKYTYKMCSRVGASIAHATGFGTQMVTDSLTAYEERAVNLALSATPSSRSTTLGPDISGELVTLRRNLFANRDRMPLFNTQLWTSNLEKGYEEVWKRWVRGGSFLHFSWEGNRDCSGYVWIQEDKT